MQNIWKTYRTPIVASGVGLALAFILAVLPLLGGDKDKRQAAADQKAQIASAVQEISADSDAEIAALKKTLAAQARTISDLKNRISNLDRGVTRTFWRSKENKNQLDTIATANQRLSDLENRISNLDRGVTRTFWRSKENKTQLDTIATANQRLSDLETQMYTLNKAVPRISKRIRDLQERTSN
ncbi:MAG: hypothetical protein ABJO09_06680 [Hyphomicrobiales bacterium]